MVTGLAQPSALPLESWSSMKGHVSLDPVRPKELRISFGVVASCSGQRSAVRHDVSYEAQSVHLYDLTLPLKASEMISTEKSVQERFNLADLSLEIPKLCAYVSRHCLLRSPSWLHDVYVSRSHS